MGYQANYGALLWVPKAAVDVEQIKKDLFIVNQSAEKAKAFSFQAKAARVGVELWEEGTTRGDRPSDWLGLPRGYTPPFVEPVEVNNVLPDFPTVVFPEFRRKLRANQEAAWEALCQTEGDKLLCLACGRGKTTLALRYAEERQTRTLIVVDREYIADQWVKEIKHCFYPLPGKGGISAKAIGRVQSSTCDVGDHFTIAVIHTLAQREFGPDFWGQFGLVVFDEAHVLGAPTFRVVVPRLAGERLLLTATPEREDGLHPVFLYHGGGLEPCHTDITRDRGCKWLFKELPRIVTEAQEAHCMRRIPGKKKRRANGKLVRERKTALLRPRFETYASASPVWFQTILRDVAHFAEEGRNILVLGGRVEQLEALNTATYFDSGLVVGETPAEERKEAFNKAQVIYATWQIAGKALDVARLDTLILLFPNDKEGFLRQAVGRTDRSEKESIVLTYGHGYCSRMEEKVADMITVVRRLDPEGSIEYVNQ